MQFLLSAYLESDLEDSQNIEPIENEASLYY